MPVCTDCEGRGQIEQACQPCQATGVEPCPTCAGQGTVSYRTGSDRRTTCHACSGKGTCACLYCNGQRAFLSPCTACHGTGQAVEAHAFAFDAPSASEGGWLSPRDSDQPNAAITAERLATDDDTRIHTQAARESLCCCINCGRTLGFLDTLAGKKAHRGCPAFLSAPGKGEIYLYCKGCEMVTRGMPSEFTDSFGAARTARKCGQCHRYE